jgi:hypothetical protein
VAEATHESAFSIMERDASLVIEIINHLIERAEKQNKPQQNTKAQQPPEVKRNFWDYV